MEYGNILSVVLENLSKLLPLRMVYSYQQGLRWTLGRPGQNLGPGWKFFLPLIESMDVIDLTVGSIDLHPQVIRTHDNKSCVIRSGLEYRIENARTYFLKIQDNDAVPTVRIVARGYIASQLSRHDYSEIWNNKEAIEASLTEKLLKKLTDWGIVPIRVHIGEFSEVRSHRFFGINDKMTPTDQPG